MNIVLYILAGFGAMFLLLLSCYGWKLVRFFWTPPWSKFK